MIWEHHRAWTGSGLHREVFYFSSGGIDLYGSLYAAAEPRVPWGLVACGSWGTEADRTDPLLRSVALAAAKLGGAGLVFHYPGYGDSFGDLAEVGLDDLRNAACSAVGEASRRCPGLGWGLAGFMLGASVASLAQRQTGAEWLLLVQPELRPGEYFRCLATTRRPLAPGPSPRQMMEVGTTPGTAYGYPVPGRILERADEADDAVAVALREFEGDGAVVRHASPPLPDHAPARFERVDVPGTWRFGSQNNPRLARAAADWLGRQAPVGVR
jgi:hypothetical protein